MILWLVPSTPFLNQTTAALEDPQHPFRVALAREFGLHVSILTKSEALAMSRVDAEGGACIIVSTIRSFRRKKSNGVADAEGPNVYQHVRSRMNHSSDLAASEADELELLEEVSRPVFSLANLFRLRRPMVIVDEA